jgi:parallel beta-helix repeat protein
MPNDPAAFMSYARFNDVHDDGQLSVFRERLAAEVRAQTGEEFEIFQDRAGVAWGQNWQQRINETLDVVTLLLVVITPGFFASKACRDELARFLDRERELGRGDLILPVYYISARELDDPHVRESDELATTLASRQFADWRELRFEPMTSPTVRKEMARLASRMRDTFWRPVSAAPRLATPPRQAGATAEPAERPATAGSLTPKTEPPTHVVDSAGRGDFATVGAAIRAASAGDRILVRPGLYEESLLVEKQLEILGDGPVEGIEIRARGRYVLAFRASVGRVANLTLRQAGGSGGWAGVEITQGRLDLEGCDISSQSLSCVAICNGADPRLRRNQIHDGTQSGVFVYDGGLGTLEDNDISGNAMAGVATKAGGDPTVRRNRIRDGKSVGVSVFDSGLGTFEDNDITANALAGVEIKDGGDPTMRRNQIRDSRTGGIFVHDKGLGTFEDNDITANAMSGVEIKTGGNPTLRRNRINRNHYQAIRIHNNGQGTLEDNDLTDNRLGPWNIAKDCEAKITRTRNKE